MTKQDKLRIPMTLRLFGTTLLRAGFAKVHTPPAPSVWKPVDHGAVDVDRGRNSQPQVLRAYNFT
jgi:hypothetical protein